VLERLTAGLRIVAECKNNNKKGEFFLIYSPLLKSLTSPISGFGTGPFTIIITSFSLFSVPQEGGYPRLSVF